MADTDIKFVGSIPQIYDELLVPLIFDPYASDLAQRLARLNAIDVLETAAGTGAATRAMAARLPAGARIVATDLNQPMLDKAKARQAGDTRIEWRQADALALPFADKSFDAVVCQFGVMFFPDRVKGYREALRVLKPGCAFLFDAWDKVEVNVFVDVINKTLAKVFPANPTEFMARVPHGYHDTAVIERDLRAGGFTSVEFEEIEHLAKASSARDAATAWCQGTPLRNEIEQRGAPGLPEVTDIVAQELAKTFGAGPIEGKIRAIVVTARP